MNGLGQKVLSQEVKVSERSFFLVLSRSLKKGEVLSEEDIRVKQASNQNLSGYFTKASDVVGRTLKKTLSVDQVLLSRHLEIDWDIRKGQKIIIQSISGPVTIENSGVARVDAQIGELIKAENEQSGKIVEGIVVSRKKIRVLTK
jgi:flagella basal body P-ring formation protein FlgA